MKYFIPLVRIEPTIVAFIFAHWYPCAITSLLILFYCFFFLILLFFNKFFYFKQIVLFIFPVWPTYPVQEV